MNLNSAGHYEHYRTYLHERTTINYEILPIKGQTVVVRFSKVIVASSDRWSVGKNAEIVSSPIVSLTTSSVFEFSKTSVAVELEGQSRSKQT